MEIHICKAPGRKAPVPGGQTRGLKAWARWGLAVLAVGLGMGLGACDLFGFEAAVVLVLPADQGSGLPGLKGPLTWAWGPSGGAAGANAAANAGGGPGRGQGAILAAPGDSISLRLPKDAWLAAWWQGESEGRFLEPWGTWRAPGGALELGLEPSRGAWARVLTQGLSRGTLENSRLEGRDWQAWWLEGHKRLGGAWARWDLGKAETALQARAAPSLVFTLLPGRDLPEGSEGLGAWIGPDGLTLAGGRLIPDRDWWAWNPQSRTFRDYPWPP